MSTAPATAAIARAPVPVLRVDHWKRVLQAGRDEARTTFFARGNTRQLLRQLARLTDAVVAGMWGECGIDPRCALVAVGGYGRGELYPHSDVDILILVPPGAAASHEATPAIERLLAALWDVGIELAHAVRTLAECATETAADITVRTSLLEHRVVAGSRRAYGEFARAFDASLDVRAFYAAKALEQQQRHLRYHDAAYNLEPNVKESPGGLRDLQTVIWIARAAGLGRTWRALAEHDLITLAEAHAVARQERAIGSLRVRLHYLAGRREDRLVFDVQAALARELGLADRAGRRASELLMQRYYRATKVVRQVNTLLLQNLHAHLYPDATAPIAIDADFQRVDELLDLRDEALFEKRPGRCSTPPSPSSAIPTCAA